MKNRQTGTIALGFVVRGIYFGGLLAASVGWRIQVGAPLPVNKSGSLDIGGRTRTYLLHVPPAYDGKKPRPLVLVLHGGTQSPESAERMSGMSAKADGENFLVAYPSGTGRVSRMPTWNSGNCCGYAMQNNVDDVAFLRALIDKLEHDYSADPRRIFVTGVSNGGMMSYRVGCELADKVAAIAPVEGAQNVDCRSSGPVSVIVFHGTADRLVRFDGGSTPFQIGPKRSDNSVANAVAFWVKRPVAHLPRNMKKTPRSTPTCTQAARTGRAWPSTPSRAGAIPGPALEPAAVASPPPTSCGLFSSSTPSPSDAPPSARTNTIRMRLLSCHATKPVGTVTCKVGRDRQVLVCFGGPRRWMKVGRNSEDARGPRSIFAA